MLDARTNPILSTLSGALKSGPYPHSFLNHHFGWPPPVPPSPASFPPPPVIYAKSKNNGNVIGNGIRNNHQQQQQKKSSSNTSTSPPESPSSSLSVPMSSAVPAATQPGQKPVAPPQPPVASGQPQQPTNNGHRPSVYGGRGPVLATTYSPYHRQHHQQRFHQQHANNNGHHHHHQSYSSPLSPSSSNFHHHHHLRYGSPSYYYGGAAAAMSATFQPSVKLQQLGSRLQSWKTASIGISFLILLLLLCKLHDVDREINYLHFVSTEWLSQQAVNQQLLAPVPALPESAASSVAAGPIDQLASNVIESRADTNSHNNLYSFMNFTDGDDEHRIPVPATLVGLPSSSPLIDYHHQSSSLMVPHSQVSTSHRLKPTAVDADDDLPASEKEENVSHHKNLHQSLQMAESSVASAHRSILAPPMPPTSETGTNLIVPEPDNSNQDVLDLANIISMISLLKEDVDILMGELMASRTTLLLSLVFVLVYILSWCWMAWAIRATNTPDVSLKTVLLLAIFAAVDIAASAGFVMVRIIMYLMRDHYFPRDMRMPIHAIEYNQLAAYVALRMVSLKSGTGVIDIFVSVIVAFLTSLRVYSVICAVTFYRRARRELLNVKNFEYLIEKPGRHFATSNNNHHLHLQHNNNSHSYNYQRSSTGNVKSSPTNSTGIKPETGAEIGQSGYLPKIRLLNAHKDLDRRFSVTGGRDGTATANNSGGENSSDVSSSSDDDPGQELKIQAADMPSSLQKSAMQATIHALRTYTTEKHIAESIKQNFDQLYEPTWHCIVGRNWGSCVTHTKSNYIRMLFKDLTILLYKSS